MEYKLDKRIQVSTSSYICSDYYVDNERIIYQAENRVIKKLIHGVEEHDILKCDFIAKSIKKMNTFLSIRNPVTGKSIFLEDYSTAVVNISLLENFGVFDNAYLKDKTFISSGNYTNKKWGVYDFLLNEIPWLKVGNPDIHSIGDSKNIYRRSAQYKNGDYAQIFESINLKTGEIVWTIDLEIFGRPLLRGDKAGKVTQIIGIFEETIIVHVAAFVLLGINKMTGELMWEIPDFYRSSNLYGISQNLHLNDQTGVISGFTINGYFEINIAEKENKGVLYDLSSFFESNWNIREYSVSDDGENFYFIGNRVNKNEINNFNSCTIGVFNSQQKEIQWYQDVVLNETTLFGKPKFTKNNLYTQDRKGMIYCFQKIGL